MSTPPQPASPVSAETLSGSPFADESNTLDLRTSHARTFGPGFVIKLVLMALINALGLYFVFLAVAQGEWVHAAVAVAALVAANYIYFSKRAVPAKYLFPGLIFLLFFQVFVIGYTGYIAFTNYGTGHNSTKADAISAILSQNERRVEGAENLPLTVVTGGLTGELGFAVVENGQAMLGTANAPLARVDGATVDGDRVTEVQGWQVLSFADVLNRQADVLALRVPTSDDVNAGSLRTQDARSAYRAVPTMTYDEAADTMTDHVTGTVYKPNSTGQFQADDGTLLPVGWRVFVGFDNFAKTFGDARYSTPFFKVLLWTVAFAFLSVATTFFLGLFLAIIFNDDRIKGRKIYRTLLILPYAFPGFLAALLWAGLLNPQFGFVNGVLLGGANIGWLTGPWLAKFSVLFVNLWLGFPYMFLICTGALQSIPGDTLEAARIDGAGRWRTFRSITMPLLLVSVTPLLISSFAFNFNNFNLIFMLTGGGPRMADASVPVGHTDILISMVYQISGLSGMADRNYGMASALSIVIFIIIATVSVIAFRRTKALEDIN